MNKAFYFHARPVINSADFLKGQLPGRHYPLHPVSPQKLRSFRPCDRHLSAGVEGELRKLLPQLSQNSEILDNNAVQAFPVKGQHILIQFLQLPVLQECIHRHIQFFSKQMHTVNSTAQLFLIQIFRIGSGAKPAAAHINRICPGRQRGLKGLKGTGRSQ